MSLKSLIEKLTVNPRKVMNIDRDLFEIGEESTDYQYSTQIKNGHSQNDNIYSKSSNSPFIGDRDWLEKLNT